MLILVSSTIRHSFFVAAPMLWNSIPLSVLSQPTAGSLNTSLSSFFFVISSFDVPFFALFCIWFCLCISLYLCTHVFLLGSTLLRLSNLLCNPSFDSKIKKDSVIFTKVRLNFIYLCCRLFNMFLTTKRHLSDVKSTYNSIFKLLELVNYPVGSLAVARLLFSFVWASGKKRVWYNDNRNPVQTFTSFQWALIGEALNFITLLTSGAPLFTLAMVNKKIPSYKELLSTLN